MPTPTQQNAADIRDVAAKLEMLESVTARQLSAVQENLKELAAECKTLRDKLAQSEIARARLEERVKAVEKGTDRRWQLAPMLIAAVSAVTAIVSLAVASKK